MSTTLRSIKWIGLVAGLLVLAYVFSRILAPGYDYYIYYDPPIRDLLAGRFSYATTDFRNPPWALLLMSPLGLVDPAMGQGLLAAVTVLVLAWVMRTYRRFPLSYTLAVVSAPMISILWLGQIEVFSLCGALIGYRAVDQRRWGQFALALLLLFIKPQETWLIIVLLTMSSIHRWRVRDWVLIGATVLSVVIGTSLVMGWGWVNELVGGAGNFIGQWQNFSLWHLLAAWPPNVIGTLWIVFAGASIYAIWRAGLSRSGLGLAAVTSNLLSPYLTSPHLLMTMSLGWGVSFDRSRRWGMLIYLTSLTPLLRIINADQALNRLDLIFPLLVLMNLAAGVIRRHA